MRSRWLRPSAPQCHMKVSVHLEDSSTSSGAMPSFFLQRENMDRQMLKSERSSLSLSQYASFVALSYIKFSSSHWNVDVCIVAAYKYTTNLSPNQAILPYTVLFNRTSIIRSSSYCTKCCLFGHSDTNTFTHRSVIISGE